MEQIIKESSRFLVIDNFLSDDHFRILWNYIQSENFSPVHSEGWAKAFRLNDGSPFRAEPSISHPRKDKHSASTFPTGKGIDLFIDALRNKTEDIKEYAGKHGIDWEFFFARPYIYPVGSGLSWHTDGKFEISAAYVFYCHPEWKASWGAELLVDDSGDFSQGYPLKQTNLDQHENVGFHIDQAAVDEHLLGKGCGHYVLPKPNRLVVIKPNTLHRIKPVDPAAGDNIRSSITGFFMHEEKIRNIKEKESK